MSTVMEAARAAIETAQQEAAVRRRSLAIVLAFGGEVDSSELVRLGAIPGELERLESDVTRFERARSAWERCQRLPELRQELEQATRDLEARRAEVDARLAAGPTSLTLRAPLVIERWNLSRPPELVAAVRAAEAAWRELLSLLPDYRDQEAARSTLETRLAGRIKAAQEAIERLDSRPLLERIRSRLAELGAALTAPVRRSKRPEELEDFEPLDRFTREEAVSVAQGRAVMGNEQSRLMAQLAKLESPEERARREDSRRSWELELAAAQREQAELRSGPSVFEILRQDFASWREMAQKKPAKGRKGA